MLYKYNFQWIVTKKVNVKTIEVLEILTLNLIKMCLSKTIYLKSKKRIRNAKSHRWITFSNFSFLFYFTDFNVKNVLQYRFYMNMHRNIRFLWYWDCHKSLHRCNPMWQSFDISNYESCWINQSKLKILMVYTTRLRKYMDSKI